MRKKLTKLPLFLVLLFFTGAAANQIFAQPKDDEWHYTLAPYMLFPGMSGTLGARGLEKDVDVNASDILSNLQFGVNGAFDARKGVWGFGVDAVYMALGASTDLVNVDPNQGAFTFLGMRKLGPGLELTFGARWNIVQNKIEIKEIPGTQLGGKTIDKTKQWVDPVIGVQWKVPIGGKVELNLPANIGGFGLASKVALDLFPTLQFKVGSRLAISGGWRFIYMNYETGYENGTAQPGSDSFRYDVVTTGPSAGLVISF